MDSIVLSTLIFWIEIYPVDSVTHSLNNWALGGDRHCQSKLLPPAPEKKNTTHPMFSFVSPTNGHMNRFWNSQCRKINIM